MIKAGDRVKFISDTGTGRVKSVEGAVAVVEVEDGFEVPVLITDLVAVDEEQEREAIRRIGLGDERPGRNRGKGAPGVPEGGKKRPSSGGALRYGRIALVDDYEDEELIDLEQIRRQYVRNAAALNEEEVRRTATEADYFPEETASPAPETFPEPEEEATEEVVIVPKKKMTRVDLSELRTAPAEPAPAPPVGPEVVDLHAEQILPSTAGLTPGEILDAQLARFTVALELAVSNRKKGKMVFIHGVGSGKLKYEMKKLLDRRYPKLSYQDASFREYGYGALLVIFS